MSLNLRSADAMLALQSLPRIGPATALKAAIRSGWAEPPVDAEILESARVRARELLSEYEESGVTVLTFFDDAYPPLLRQIADPPPVLYVRGDLGPISDARAVAVVGTREPSAFGVTAARHLTRALSGAGWVIVSGLAKGIDTLAHKTAVESGGRTVAIFGSGLDRVYPTENRKLVDEIVSTGGAVMSELPFGAPPIPRNLINRDRLQSGMSAAVLICQTGIKGGTLHTARFAAEQKRPIFCPEPHGENGKSEGLRVLLEQPAGKLDKVLPAWRAHARLTARLGERPIARPVRRDGTDAFLDEMELASASMGMTDDSLVIPGLAV